MKSTKQERLQRRKARVRSKLAGTAERPRVSPFISNKNAYVQVIDDTTGKTLCASHSFKEKTINISIAEKVAKDLAAKMKKAGITTVVFDRNGKQFHGKVKVIADTLRSEGIVL